MKVLENSVSILEIRHAWVREISACIVLEMKVLEISASMLEIRLAWCLKSVRSYSHLNV